jgi:hypothetical protein
VTSVRGGYRRATLGIGQYENPLVLEYSFTLIDMSPVPARHRTTKGGQPATVRPVAWERGRSQSLRALGLRFRIFTELSPRTPVSTAIGWGEM